MDTYDANDCVGFDPYSPEDASVTLGQIIEFINAERALAGRPRARSVIVVGSDTPYEQFGGESPLFI